MCNSALKVGSYYILWPYDDYQVTVLWISDKQLPNDLWLSDRWLPNDRPRTTPGPPQEHFILSVTHLSNDFNVEDNQTNCWYDKSNNKSNPGSVDKFVKFMVCQICLSRADSAIDIFFILMFTIGRNIVNKRKQSDQGY